MGFKARQRPPSLETLLSGEEGRDLVYTLSAVTLRQEDLVAFANSEQGGTIVVGVLQDEDGGLSIAGCPGGVRAKGAIGRVAKQCVPPVVIAVTEYVQDKKRVFQVDVAASPARPHCTEAGAYTIREGGRAVPLTPDRLGAFFAGAVEPAAPRSDAADTAEALSKEAITLRKHVHQSLRSAEEAIADLGTRIESKLAKVANLVEASEEDDFLHIGLSTIKQAQKIGFDSLSKRLDDTAQLLYSLLKRSGLARAERTWKLETSLPPLVLVQLKRNGGGFLDRVDMDDDALEEMDDDDDVVRAGAGDDEE